MERQQNTNLELIAKQIKKKAPIGVALVLVAGAVGVSAQAEGKDPYVYSSVPQEEFMPYVSSKDILDLNVAIPSAPPLKTEKPAPVKTEKPNPTQTKTDYDFKWKIDPEISWYGPGFYGKKTACGLALTKELQGVANRDLPCGTMVTFEWEGNQITIPVVDRGPYVDGRIFDLTGGACLALEHCFTGPISYFIQKN